MIEEDDVLGQFLRVFLGIGTLMTGCSIVMLFVQPRDSAEFVISVCNIFIGLALIGGVMIAVRVFKTPQ
ncbi:MAG: hypothetical protein KJ064_06780 [Anaerolineae bacterium]|nr:hypothetical protein [Anaerolineae bacterium]